MAWLLTWLVHGLAIALLVRLALRALPGLSAATRYALWWAALVLVLILPIVRGLTIGTEAVASPPVASAAPDASASVVPGASESIQSFSLPPVPLPRVPDWLLAIVIGLWLGTAMIGLAQVVYSVQAVRRLKESCRRMVMPRESDLPMWSAVRDRGRAVRVRGSDRLRTAAVLGLTRPIIVVPRGTAAALTAHEIDQVVLHEYAHVQRYDDWTKLGQVLIGAFFGWHPAVRLMMREIDFEREAACDDYVVDVTGAPRAYARCLTKVIEMMPGPGLAAVPYASSSANHAATRIERLLDGRRPSGRLAMMPAMAGSATLAVLAFCTVYALPIATDLPRPSSSPSAMRDAAVVIDARDGIAESTRVEAVAAAGEQRSPAASSALGMRGHELRIAAASTVPIALPFSRFSPLSRLTDARLPASPGAGMPPVAIAPAPAAELPSSPSVVPAPTTVPVVPKSTGPAHADKAAGAPAAIAPATAVAHVSPITIAPKQAETNFALGPVGSAADSDAMPEPSDAGHIERAWETTRDATSMAFGVSARAVGSATKTAGDATKTATEKAAAGMKASGAKTARAFGRVKRTLASVF